MIHLTDLQIRHLLADDAMNRHLLATAFIELEQQQAAQLARQRIEAQGVKLSTLAAVLPNQGVAGAKVYTTIQGRFTFVIILFSTETGAVLAVLDAEQITKKRTAACSVLMAQQFACANPKKLAVFGLGTQGTEHVIQMAEAFNFEQIEIVTRQPYAEKIERLQDQLRTTVISSTAEQAIVDADIIVTATRATTPLIMGKGLKSNAFIAAVGSSLPTTRELSDSVIQKADMIVVESKEQSLKEAGDLILSSHVHSSEKLHTVGEVLANKMLPSESYELVIYKAVGVALEDIVLAGLAYKNFVKN
ncbi:ornithine cyclodeaminase family protein [Paenalcaligenes hominis]|uniref:ornithine cyclodeaminase family protein n=1 Tax=Paenalcaligenes hominis TaxID=643674 RepID=UPI00352610FB